MEVDIRAQLHSLEIKIGRPIAYHSHIQITQKCPRTLFALKKITKVKRNNSNASRTKTIAVPPIINKSNIHELDTTDHQLFQSHNQD